MMEKHGEIWLEVEIILKGIKYTAWIWSNMQRGWGLDWKWWKYVGGIWWNMVECWGYNEEDVVLYVIDEYVEIWIEVEVGI